MKIAYLGKTPLSDVDLSYLSVAQHKSDIDYYIEITPRYLKGAAICIDKIYPKSGIFKAIDVYPQFERFRNIINLNNVYAVNTSGNKIWLIKAFWTNLLFLVHLLKNKYNVIHITWPLNIYESCLYVLKRKIILTVHDPFPHSGNNSKIVRFRRWCAFKLIKRFILLNNTQHNDFIKTYKLENKKIIDSKLGAYTYLKKIPSSKSQYIPDNYVLFFGRVSPYKGIEYLLEAIKIIHPQMPRLTLIVAGSGKYYFDTSPYNNLPFIIFINRFIPDEELTPLIKNAKFIICPYADATQSGVVMSAYAFNKPVLATNVGALPEMVINNYNGIIVQAKNSQALSEGILSMSPSKIKLFASNIEKDYSFGENSWEVIVEHILKEYKEICKES